MPAGNGKRSFPACYVRPMLRRVEVERLAVWRQGCGRYTDPHAAMTVAGHAIASLEGMRLRNHPIHPGLDILTAEEFLKRARLDLTENDTMRIISEIHRSREGERPFVMTDVIAGHLLALQREERTNLDITTLEATDEPAEARRARKAAEKRTRDRERQQQLRRAAGAVPKPSVSAEKPRPWEAAGISRRTWFRRQKSAVEEVGTTASRTSARGTAASRTSIIEPPRFSSAIHGAETAVAAVEIAAAEEHFLTMLGNGSAAAGRQVAGRLSKDEIARWRHAVFHGVVTDEMKTAIARRAHEARSSQRKTGAA